MRQLSTLVIGFVLIFFSPGCNLSLNESIEIANGETIRHSLNSVNGNITIGRNCEIRGTCRTVNGNIRVGADSRVRDLESVNGFCEVSRHVLVSGDIQTVNGWIECSPGVKVRGNIQSINGSITIRQTVVKQNIEIRNGMIEILRKSRVKGDIIINKSGNSEEPRKTIRIVIADSSVVEGDVWIRERDRKVKIYLRSGGKLLGDPGIAEIVNEEQ